jgi:hypothetical protein
MTQPVKQALAILSALGFPRAQQNERSALLYDAKRNWLLLVEAVTSHGPMDAKRHGELAVLFAASPAGLVYVTAFPNRSVMSRYAGEIAWESEVWVADAPTHLIHFNGSRFLGPHTREEER